MPSHPLAGMLGTHPRQAPQRAEEARQIIAHRQGKKVFGAPSPVSGKRP